MADGLPDINIIGQKALALPADLVGLEMQQMSARMNLLNAKATEAGSILLPTGGFALPALPNLANGLQLPGLPGTAAASAPAPAPKAQARSITNKPRSYLQQ